MVWNGWPAVMGVWSFTSCTRHWWRKTKEQKPWNNTKQDFSLNRQQRRLLFYVICVQYTRFWPEFRSHCLHKLSIHFVRKVYIWLSWSVWGNFKNYASGNHVMAMMTLLNTIYRRTTKSTLTLRPALRISQTAINDSL